MPVTKDQTEQCPHAELIRYGVFQDIQFFTEVGCEGVGGLNAGEIEGLILDAMKEKLQQFEALSSPQKTIENPHIAELNVRIVQIKSEIDSLIDKLAMAN